MAIVTASGLVGCDPGIDVSGVVRDGASSPIGGAEVTLMCPGARHDNRTTSTDASGHFRVPVEFGCLKPDCKLSVRAADGKAKEYMVRDHCKDRSSMCGAGCNVVSLDAVL
ncbi:carboxypeptidase-like regulatory domain-containing protein [Sorangium sp. So ce204]|uniref:carboxypeptidase-like regulatory domain-containing protein n=1 Tax=Sorangium sp. So ce204 TaxID=3133288 RepID=UPI003F63D7E7